MNTNLVIIGPPGSGKTTLLKHVALALVSRTRISAQAEIPQKLPILLFLRDYIDAVRDNTNFSLLNAVQGLLNRWELRTSSLWIEEQLARGRCFILLDGLDEVADPYARRQIVAWIQRQMIVHGKNRFIITSLPAGYRDNPLAGVTLLEVLPFASQQVKQFIHNWYLANEIMSSKQDDRSIRLMAIEGADDLLRRINNTPALATFAVNPLLLTMIATVHRYRGSLPGHRVELYAEICNVFLGKRQEAQGIVAELPAAQKQIALQSLAFHMMSKGVREISRSEARVSIEEPLAMITSRMTPADFLRLVEDTSGLLVEREIGVYSFAHLTFQEYLAATYVRENDLVGVLVEQIGNSWWHETIRLYCAQADATPIIAACLRGNPSMSALTLALECRNEALKMQPDLSDRLNILPSQVSQGAEDSAPNQ